MIYLFFTFVSGVIIDSLLTVENLSFNYSNPFSVFVGERKVASFGECKFLTEFDERPVWGIDREIKVTIGAQISSVNVTSEFVVQNVKQWMLFFNNDLTFFSANSTSSCNGERGIGGHCVENKNGFRLHLDLPKISYIKLTFTLSLLDFWQGQTFFVGIVSEEEIIQYVYTQTADTKNLTSGVDVCGAPFKDTLYGKTIETVFEWNSSTINLIFDSKLNEDPCIVSFFITNIKIYTL